MLFVYGIVIRLYILCITIAALFHPKAKAWMQGRKHINFASIKRIKKHAAEKHLWLHCASLGEFDQGIVLIEKIMQDNIEWKLLLTFFSPSGYEAKKNYKSASHIMYLPIDTETNAKSLINNWQPDYVFFVKYEIWYHYLNECILQKIPVYLIAATFRYSQYYFKWYGKKWLQLLQQFNIINVQDQNSYDLLKLYGFDNLLLTNDTRYDKCIENAHTEYENDIVEKFVARMNTLILGSAWQQELDIVLSSWSKIKHYTPKLIIAPHEMELVPYIEQLLSSYPINYQRFTSYNATILDTEVMILDTIGHLSKVYRYANIAMIGGGYRGTLHNILEAAAYGLPIMMGDNVSKFPEAIEMEQNGVAAIIHSQQECTEIIAHWCQNYLYYKEKQLQYFGTRLGGVEKIRMAIAIG